MCSEQGLCSLRVLHIYVVWIRVEVEFEFEV